MQVIQLSLLTLLSTYVAAQDIDNNDVPVQCRAVCANVITLTQNCDRQNDDNDRNYINCICSSPNAAAEVPACEACVANFDRNDGADNDVNDLVRSCSFARTSYVSMTGSSTATSGASVTSLTPTGVTSSAPTNTASSAIASLSSVLDSLSATASDRAASASSSLASLTSAAATPTSTPNAARANGVKAAGVVGAVFLGLIGLA